MVSADDAPETGPDRWPSGARPNAGGNAGIVVGPDLRAAVRVPGPRDDPESQMIRTTPVPIADMRAVPACFAMSEGRA